ncbi:FMN-dependent NADH-azoreductase [Endozoicomonas sp. SCSIO W0465]|uniref:FMN-dependent NADH-azoreductase n=1 Tax=Endozoicomonas sp. SCSIO W0465 TaxID=2918516 RepID=UPI0021122541|nr:NAD(P)H-dependent oxidoreductase [Endozoicomonas sp. SCSIO W0465]
MNSSLFGEHGQSTQLSQKFVQRFLTVNPDTQHKMRDLAIAQIPHLDAEIVMGFGTPEDQKNDRQVEMTALSDLLIEEVRSADVLVIGLPMYNFSLPSTLKSWFDFIARAGVTFKYTEQGPVGLLAGKKAYIMAARGGQYAGTEHDTQTALVRHFLSFIGIQDVEFVYAEGLNMGDDIKGQAINDAEKVIDSLVA